MEAVDWDGHIVSDTKELSANDCNQVVNEPEPETKENIDHYSPLSHNSTPQYSVETTDADTPIDQNQCNPNIAINKKTQKQFIQQHIINDKNHLFNKISYEMHHNSPSEMHINTTSHKTKIAISSSTGWNKGIHEWSLKILVCETYQEIGVVSDNQNMCLDKNGIAHSKHFGAKALYGNFQHDSWMPFYASYNTNGDKRCFRDLPPHNKWKSGDVIRVRVNLDKCNITFYLNGKKVRKVISLQNGCTYYPIMAFSGDCKYEIIN